MTPESSTISLDISCNSFDYLLIVIMFVKKSLVAAQFYSDGHHCLKIFLS